MAEICGREYARLAKSSTRNVRYCVRTSRKSRVHTTGNRKKRAALDFPKTDNSANKFDEQRRKKIKQKAHFP
jgi:hypothetical protein